MRPKARLAYTITAVGPSGRTCSLKPHRSPGLKADKRQEERILELRRERRLGVKRIRNEMQRLHEAKLSATTIHRVLVRHNLNVLPTRKRVRHKSKRYNRPVPGDRVQMDTCKIRPGIYQFTAIDDCSRFLVAGLARRRSAAETLAFLDRVLEEMPVAIQRIQTDRGTEFFAEKVQRRLSRTCARRSGGWIARSERMRSRYTERTPTPT